MTQNDIRRKALRKEESLFLQQASYLQKIGRKKARETENGAIADQLRDLDLLVWDETERYLSRFATDLNYAPYIVDDLIAETARIGRPLGMELELPSLVAALTFVRILAGGDDVYEKHKPICFSIMNSQVRDPQAKHLFEEYCQEIEANKKDPATGEETLYRRGDPMERAKDTEEAKAEARIEELLGQILEATEGWNTEKVFGNYWEQWTELWVHLLKQEEMMEKVSNKCPSRSENLTEINIRLVCNVAGLMKKHLEKVLRRPALSDTSFADKIKKSWTADTRRREVCKTTEIKGQENQINGWLAMYIK